jgi:hypothetical protein
MLLQHVPAEEIERPVFDAARGAANGDSILKVLVVLGGGVILAFVKAYVKNVSETNPELSDRMSRIAGVILGLGALIGIVALVVYNWPK